MEELLSRHRKEIRDLTSRITQKKKSATKKTRKGVNTECEALERDLKERHARETAELENPSSTIDNDSDEEPDVIPETPSEATEQSEPATVPPLPDPPSGRKPSRQKARLARRAANFAAITAAAEAEAAAAPDRRSHEITAMQARLETLGLTEHTIAPDGHCLYSAFADQVRHVADPPDYKRARERCADCMLSHRADFEPFLDDPFEDHVRKVRETAEWGGQTEVLALARAFGVVANVVQVEGRGVERMNEDGEGEVWLGYYRHSFGLGEHYNSLRKE